jgi:hypothetical protein
VDSGLRFTEGYHRGGHLGFTDARYRRECKYDLQGSLRIRSVGSLSPCAGMAVGWKLPSSPGHIYFDIPFVPSIVDPETYYRKGLRSLIKSALFTDGWRKFKFSPSSRRLPRKRIKKGLGLSPLLTKPALNLALDRQNLRTF